MAAPKGKDIKEQLFKEIIIDISDNGKSLISSLKSRMSSQTFYDMLENDSEKSKRYARACDDRAELMADEMLIIADNVGGDMLILPDGREVVDNAVIQRDRLRVDSRKWLLAKLHPKKYGDKIDLTSDGKELTPTTVIFNRHGNSDSGK
jgi:hypothetical protein